MNGTFKIKMHPLFIVFGCIFIVLGYGVEFLIYLFTALYHEFAHFLVANKLGVALKETYLTPFGACLKCEMIGQPSVKELSVAAAGCIANLIAAAACFALWWLFPSMYSYTHLLCEANVIMASVNLLPCYPLDGGRALFVLLKNKFSEKTAVNAMKILGLIFSIGFLCLFVLLLQDGVNVTALSLSIFIFLGAMTELKNDVLFARAEAIYAKGKKKDVTQMKTYVIENDEKLIGLIKFVTPSSYAVFKYQNVTFDERTLMKNLVEGRSNEHISSVFDRKF